MFIYACYSAGTKIMIRDGAYLAGEKQAGKRDGTTKSGDKATMRAHHKR